MRKVLFLVVFMMMVLCGNAQPQRADYRVVPLPHSIEMGKGVLVSGRQDIEQMVTRKVSAKLQKTVGTEGYVLTIGKKGIQIEAADSAGLFYGEQTLYKSLPVDGDTIQLPYAKITDQPRFHYRGMHLDVCRHFFPISFVKKYLDIMALHGLNTFHWHLTDDQGWRIDVPGYPRLKEVAAWRSGTVVGRNSEVYDGVPHGGIYTKEELKEIVEYAKERHITVIPEIDMPGHMLAALAAYPELGCTGGPYEVGQSWGVFDDILCAGKEETFRFVKAVLDDVMDVFPSEYIHIGGDEAPKKRWDACPLCKDRMEKEQLANSNELQGYFTKRVESYLNSKGKRVIGWDEILDCKVNPSATIMSWRGVDGGLRASALGHDVIMAPTQYCYFDYYQTKDRIDYTPFVFNADVLLSKMYSLDPAPDSLSEDVRKHILGAQANLWTEYIGYESVAEYQILPRMAALAEVDWCTTDKKDYDDFVKRLDRLQTIYDQKGWRYCSRRE